MPVQREVLDQYRRLASLAASLIASHPNIHVEVVGLEKRTAGHLLDILTDVIDGVYSSRAQREQQYGDLLDKCSREWYDHEHDHDMEPLP